MNGSDDQESADFLFFSREYSQAQEALEALRNQASTLVVMGNGEELNIFIDQFVSMARATAAEADARDLSHFEEWFSELIRKAEELRGSS
ncbi:MAG: hypothetical protein ABI718_09970 [Acidobacteriota bacterium]